MNVEKLSHSLYKNKEHFHKYIQKIKATMLVDVYSISNITLIKNPYTSVFPLHYFLKKAIVVPLWILFVKNTLKFYFKQFYFLMNYIISWVLFKIFYRQNRANQVETTLIDVFFLVETITKEKNFQENYFKGLYDIFDKHDVGYTFIPRIYSTNKNPFSLIPFFKILSKDKRSFLFEFELLGIGDILKIWWMIVAYPFKTLRLLTKSEDIYDTIFNQSLLQDIATQGMNTFSRYIFGKNIAKRKNVKQVISWSEFQVIERSFNYAIRQHNSDIELIGCQFYLNYETYFNAYVEDIDESQKTAFHKVLVNGNAYIQKRNKVTYGLGVALRYKDIFLYKNISEGKNLLVLGSYIVSDTKYMLESVAELDNVCFKNHPAVPLTKLGDIDKDITIVEENIYQLFTSVSLVIGTASGTSVEAISCGKSVIIIASQDNLTANPLVEYGKGKIWEIAFSKDDVEKHYNKLIKYRNEHPKAIEKIANWYKENFFVEPTEENIIKAFELEGFKK